MKENANLAAYARRGLEGKPVEMRKKASRNGKESREMGGKAGEM